MKIITESIIIGSVSLLIFVVFVISITAPPTEADINYYYDEDGDLILQLETLMPDYITEWLMTFPQVINITQVYTNEGYVHRIELDHEASLPERQEVIDYVENIAMQTDMNNARTQYMPIAQAIPLCMIDYANQTDPKYNGVYMYNNNFVIIPEDPKCD